MGEFYISQLVDNLSIKTIFLPFSGVFSKSKLLSLNRIILDLIKNSAQAVLNLNYPLVKEFQTAGIDSC